MALDPQLFDKLQSVLARADVARTKSSVVSPQEMTAPAGAPPTQPGGMPMDPAAAGGMPMDPAAAGGMPMDPAAAGGMPPGEDPLIAMLEQMAKDVAQTKSLVATLIDQAGIKIPTKDILQSGEDVVADSAMKAGIAYVSTDVREDASGDGSEDGYVISPGDDGYAAALPGDAQDLTKRSFSLDASLQYAAAVFAQGQ